MEKLIVILVFAAIALINKALRKGDSTDNSPPLTPRLPPTAPRRPQADQSEEERVRKFMEALGVPPGSAVPPKKIERPQQPVPRVRPQVKVETPPPVTARRTPAPLPVQQQPAGQVSAYDLPAQASAIAEVVTIPAVKTAILSDAANSLPANDFKALLKSPGSLRTAFVLREILGPPRSLQSFSNAPSFP